MKAEDVEIRVTLKDEFTPAVKRIQRRLWWWQHGDQVVAAAVGVVSFLAGLVVGGAIR